MTVYFRQDLHAHILAGVLLLIRGALAQGGSAQFIAGALAMAQHSALSVGIDWSDLLDSARAQLNTSGCQLLDAALQARMLDG